MRERGDKKESREERGERECGKKRVLARGKKKKKNKGKGERVGYKEIDIG